MPVPLSQLQQQLLQLQPPQPRQQQQRNQQNQQEKLHKKHRLQQQIISTASQHLLSSFSLFLVESKIISTRKCQFNLSFK